jgi:hypothetical protein
MNTLSCWERMHTIKAIRVAIRADNPMTAGDHP